MLLEVFIGCFFLGTYLLVKFIRGVIRDDAIEQEKLHPELFNKTKVQPTKQKKPAKWLTFRGLQIALGILWLLDGLLQLQHQMFSKAFITQVVAPAAQGQPSFVSGPINLGSHLFLLHPAIFNSLAAITQIGIGVLILYKRTTKLGLLTSVFWGLVVWIFGEGYGGIFSGHTLLLMGAPGAVSLYVLLALASWPKKHQKQHRIKQPQVAYWLVFVWVVLWVGGGVYQLLPGQNTTLELSSMIAANSSGAPGWLASVDNHSAQFVKSFGEVYGKPTNKAIVGINMTGMQMSQASTPGNPGFPFILFLALLQIGIGIGVLFSRLTRKSAIGLGVLLTLIFWVVGQSLGGYYTGTATDPNIGPLVVLLGLAILGCSDLDLKLSRVKSSISRVTIKWFENIQRPEAVRPISKISD